MRFQKQPALCIAILAVRSAFAADSAPPANPDPFPAFRTAPAKPPAADADRPLPPGDPAPRPATTPSLLPDEIPIPTKRPAPVKPPGAGKPGTALKPQATAEEFDLLIRYRKARNVAEMNEKVRAAWDDSRDAKTDLRKRETLKHYYDVLFAKMLAVDRGIALLVDQRHKAENARLTQTQIAPTIPTE